MQKTKDFSYYKFIIQNKNRFYLFRNENALKICLGKFQNEKRQVKILFLTNNKKITIYLS